MCAPAPHPLRPHSQRLWAQHDANNNVTSIADVTGTVVQRFQEDPYGGNPLVFTGNWQLTTDNYTWLYIHQTGRYDPVAGVIHFRNRDLDPNTGAWRTFDPNPAGPYVDGMSGYEYVRSSPADTIDPEGTTGRKGKPVTAPGGTLGGPRDPNAQPTPGQEKGVVIQSDVGWLMNPCWRLKYNQYVDDVQKRWPKVDTYPSGVTPAQFGNILRDPSVVEIVFIGHGMDSDGFGIIWLDDKNGILASDVKSVIGKSKSLKRVTLRSCWQGGPKATNDWIEAFGILPSQFYAPAWNDKWWYNDPGNPIPAPPTSPRPAPPTTQPVAPPTTRPTTQPA